MASRQEPMERALITPALLRELLEYEAATGRLFWRHRDPHHFANECRSRAWNTRHAGKEAFTVSADGYRRGMVFRRMHMAHIAAWAIHYGEWPNDFIDHINGVRDDNRIANLRDVTRTENARNAKRKSTNTSGATGVFPHKDKWRAFINLHLGIFDTFEEAVAARKEAERRLGYHPNHGRAE